MIELKDHQKKALPKIKNGCILNGEPGSGKSLTALAYYYIHFGGSLKELTKMENPKDLYIITTAKKRDSLDWEDECTWFLIGNEQLYSNVVKVDSWNNIKKYADIKDSFFIFDEQRLVGSGAWVKAFLKIVKSNEWILLSATPGDTWMDYIPVFVANGFYKNRTDFIRRHVVYKRFVKYPVVDRYLDEGILHKHRKEILVDMPFHRHTVQLHEDILCDYDKDLYKTICKTRWNPYTDEPIQNAGEFCYVLRRCVNTSESRQTALLELMEEHDRVIIFYNFDYELEILKGLYYGDKYEIAEWNGHNHQSIPSSDRWVYLVQYTAGCEGWNCTQTDTIIFYSQNYSYKVMVQAAGRTDRMNTPYRELYYYHLKSRAGIDLAINRALKNKRNFNIKGFAEGF